MAQKDSLVSKSSKQAKKEGIGEREKEEGERRTGESEVSFFFFELFLLLVQAPQGLFA